MPVTTVPSSLVLSPIRTAQASATFRRCDPCETIGSVKTLFLSSRRKETCHETGVVTEIDGGVGRNPLARRTACNFDNRCSGAAEARRMIRQRRPRWIARSLVADLPTYFAKVVDTSQREEIYKIQARYDVQVSKLQQQLEGIDRQTRRGGGRCAVRRADGEVAKMRSEREARRRKSSDDQGSGPCPVSSAISRRQPSGRRDVPCTGFHRGRRQTVRRQALFHPRVRLLSCRTGVGWNCRTPRCTTSRGCRAGSCFILSLISPFKCWNTDDLSVCFRIRRTTVLGASPPQDEPCSKVVLGRLPDNVRAVTGRRSLRNGRQHGAVTERQALEGG